MTSSIFPSWREVEHIDSISHRELDELPFGAIQLDRAGRILLYNLPESKISGRKPEEVVGCNFFTEIAPCTNVREFAGRFREGFIRKKLDAVFPYVFDFRMAPTKVWIRLYYSDTTGTAWVFVRRRTEAEFD